MTMRWILVLGLLAATGCAAQEPPQPQSPPPLSSQAPLSPQPPMAALEPSLPAPAPPEPKLKLSVFTASPEGFLVTSTLVSGATDAILIDAQFTLGDAKKLAEMVKASGKKLTTVYVTHAHPDHYFGFGALKEAFPEAKLVALPATVAQIQKTWAAKVKQWKPIYKDAIPAQPVVPEPLTGTSIELEGERLELVAPVQGDDAQCSYVYVPSLGAVVAGDIVYDDVFPWTAETTREQRTAWVAALDGIQGRAPKWVVPGHQKPEGKQSLASVQFTKDYLAAFDETVAGSKNAGEVQTKLKAKYPTTGLDIILKIGSEAAFKHGAPGPANKAPAAAKTDPAALKANANTPASMKADPGAAKPATSPKAPAK